MRLMLLLLMLLAVFASFTLKTGVVRERNSYNDLAAAIEKKIEQHVVAGKPGMPNVTILSNGNIIISYAGSLQAARFNLYRLYKTDGVIWGMINEGDRIDFRTSEKELVTLRFTDKAIAAGIYDAFISLLLLGKEKYEPGLTLRKQETIDSINAMMSRLAAHQPQLKLSSNGYMIITTNNRQFFSFDIARLASGPFSVGFEVNGIEMVPRTVSKVGVHNWINFNTDKGTVAYIKFCNVNDADINTLHHLFLHLRASMMRPIYS